jgi:peptide/nickel transport system substrate-binding protein
MMSIVPCSGNPDSPFADPLVRQAVDYAIDKESICNSVFFGLAEPVYRFAPKGPMRYDVPGFVGRKYDPEKAKQLLTDAGYPDGFETVYYSATHFSGADAQAIQANLNAVGIQTTIDPITPGKWQELETNGWDDGLLLSPTPLNPGFTRYTTSLLRYIVTPTEPQWSYGLYWTAFKRPAELEVLVQKYALIPEDNEDELWDTALAIQEILYEEALVLPLFEQMGGNIQQPWVMDMGFGSVYSGFDYLHCWIAPH